MISFATPYKKVKAKKNNIRKYKNKAILYSSMVDMNFIDYSIPSWQIRRTFCFILQCIDSYFLVVCEMPQKAANEKKNKTIYIYIYIYDITEKIDNSY